MGAGRARLQVHDPAGGRAAGAILVLHRAGATAPVLPPDPLEEVHLEQEEGDDPEEGLGGRHGTNVSAPPEDGQWSGRPNRPAGGSYVTTDTGRSDSRRDRSAPNIRVARERRRG